MSHNQIFLLLAVAKAIFIDDVVCLLSESRGGIKSFNHEPDWGVSQSVSDRRFDFFAGNILGSYRTCTVSDCV